MTEPQDIAERHTGVGAHAYADKTPSVPSLASTPAEDPELFHAQRIAEAAYRDAMSYEPRAPQRMSFPTVMRAVYDDAYDVGVAQRGTQVSPPHPHDVAAAAQRAELEKHG